TSGVAFTGFGLPDVAAAGVASLGLSGALSAGLFAAASCVVSFGFSCAAFRCSAQIPHPTTHRLKPRTRSLPLISPPYEKRHATQGGPQPAANPNSLSLGVYT